MGIEAELPPPRHIDEWWGFLTGDQRHALTSHLRGQTRVWFIAAFVLLSVVAVGCGAAFFLTQRMAFDVLYRSLKADTYAGVDRSDPEADQAAYGQFVGKLQAIVLYRQNSPSAFLLGASSFCLGMIFGFCLLERRRRKAMRLAKLLPPPGVTTSLA